MSTPEEIDAADRKAHDRALWKATLLPSLLTALVGIVISTLAAHRPGLNGGLLASVVVIIFFSVHLVVLGISKDLDPILTMGLAMFSYFATILLMAGFLILVDKVTSPASVSRGAFGACAIAITMAWLVGEIRAFTKAKLHLPLPKK